MTVALDIAASMQIALDRDISTVNNNIANMNTAGFQEDMMLFREYLGGKDSLETFSYVEDNVTTRSLALGSIQHTGNQLHVANQGNGYFALQTADGIRYTRSGMFLQDANNQLVDVNGNLVLDIGNGPIALPANGEQISIAADGTISTKEGVIGQLGVFTFANEYDMEKVGQTSYETAQAPIVSEEANIVQYAYERSNVNAIKATTDLIELHRKYQQVQRMIETDLKKDAEIIDKMVKIPPAA